MTPQRQRFELRGIGYVTITCSIDRTAAGRAVRLAFRDGCRTSSDEGRAGIANTSGRLDPLVDELRRADPPLP
jgi:hypothetical protein